MFLDLENCFLNWFTLSRELMSGCLILLSIYRNARNLNLRYLQPVLFSQELDGGFRRLVLFYIVLYDVGVVLLPVNGSALLC